MSESEDGQFYSFVDAPESEIVFLTKSLRVVKQTAMVKTGISGSTGEMVSYIAEKLVKGMDSLGVPTDRWEFLHSSTDDFIRVQ